MAIYSVETFARKEGAIGIGTERRIYIVQATSVHNARKAAIDAAYKEGGLEHVQPIGQVRKLTNMAALAHGWR